MSTIPEGFCQCGCGEKTPVAAMTRKKLGHVKGQPIKFISGHNARMAGAHAAQRAERNVNAAAFKAYWCAQRPNIPYGFCWCGCGEMTTIAATTFKARHVVRGEPMKYVSGHNTSLSPVEYLKEDCGYASPCWIWQRHISSGGYAKMGRRFAYAVYYERAHGPIPDGLELDHLCRVRSCVNPDHLEPVTHAENMRRGAVTKLTAGQVREVRQLRESGMFYYQIAEKYGVWPSTIERIVNGKSWA